MSEEKPPETVEQEAATPETVEEAPEGAPSDAPQQVAPEDVLAIFQQAVDQSGVEGPLPNMILNLVGSALTQARQSGELKETRTGGSVSASVVATPPNIELTGFEAGEAAAAAATDAVGNAPSEAGQNVVDLEQERVERAPREPTEFERTLQANLTEAFQGYLAEHVVDVDADEPEVNVDAQYLQNHGPAMLASAFGAFTRTIVPEEIKVEVPSGEGGEKKVALKLDLSGLLGNLTINPPAKNGDTDA